MIELVNQPTGDSCTSACLSMLTGIDVNQVVEQFHKDWQTNQSDPSEFLSKHGIRSYAHNKVFDHRLDWGTIYLATVPSLNIEGGLHHILIDLSGDKIRVLDPNNGKEGKRYYVEWYCDNLESMQVKLTSWIVDLHIDPKDLRFS